ncbi:hypothetical protein [Desulforegula conservatrix]|uniref:hypothetical protein n=1 Tax=Desulforegula conservatrix TaxID=153026 RepID=UPI00042A60FE|nr:hypothetical protein [Desulforegula conservatrix]
MKTKRYIIDVFILLALFVCLAGCKAGNSIDYSTKPTATTTKGDYDFSEGKIYVTNQIKQTISMANIDGSGGVSLGSINTHMISPVDIVVDSSREKIFISNAEGGDVFKANLDGSESIDTRATCMVGEDWSVAMTYTLEIDPVIGKLYVSGLKSKMVNKRVYVRGDDPTVIIQANLDGSDKRFIAQDILKKIDPESKHIMLGGIDAKHRTMYFWYRDTVIMGKMDNNEIKMIRKGVIGNFAIDPENEKIYWITWQENPYDSMTSNKIPDKALKSLDNMKEFVYSKHESGKFYIHRTNLDGSDLLNLGDMNGLLDQPTSIALDPVNKKMYIGNGGNSTIIRANLDGTSAENLGNLNGTVDHPRGIAILPPGVVEKPKNSKE